MVDLDRFVQRRHRPESLEFREDLGVRRIVGRIYPVMMMTAPCISASRARAPARFHSSMLELLLCNKKGEHFALPMS